MVEGREESEEEGGMEEEMVRNGWGSREGKRVRQTHPQ